MRTRIAGALAAAALVAVTFALDPWVYRSISFREVDAHDWGRLLRVSGSLVFWIPLALALWLEDRWRGQSRSGVAWVVAAGPTVAGAAAELAKLIVRRERPGLHDGEYFYRAFSDRLFDTHDLGLPSSHVMVAFGGAAVLAKRYPGIAPLIYALAVGCALARLLPRAHFLSDVFVGAIGGWAIGSWIAGRMLPSPPRTI